jgi:hypothetical protein
MERSSTRAYRRIPKTLYNRVVAAYPNVIPDNDDGHYGMNLSFYKEDTDTIGCIFIAKYSSSEDGTTADKYYSVSYTEDEVKHFNDWLLKTYPPRTKKNSKRTQREYYDDDDLVFEII